MRGDASKPSSKVPASAGQSANSSSRHVRTWITAIVVASILVYLPFVLSDRSLFGYRLSNMQLLNIGLTQVNLMLIAILGAISLNYLTGCAGLVSIGHAAFYGVGAVVGAITGTQWGWPFLVVLLAAGAVGAVAGLLAGLPSLRVRGLYFVLSTLALHFIVVFVMAEYQYKYFDVVGIPLNEASIGSFVIDSPLRWYFFLLPMVLLVYVGLNTSLRAREGRAMMAMRDHELAATAAGIDVRILRLKAFGLSSAVAAVAGALYSYYLTNVNADLFNINFAIQFIAMIIIGGMGSMAGAVLGAALWLLLPAVITGVATQLSPASGFVGHLLTQSKPQLVHLTFGVLVILILIFAPSGLAGIGAQVGGFFKRIRATRGQHS